MNHYFRQIAISITLASALVGVVGCGQSVDDPDGATSIRSLEPSVSADGSRFTFEYEIMDPEGDDTRLRFQVCEVDDGSPVACGAPVQGPLGAGTKFVPTVPAGEFVTHVFHWNLGCGRFVGTERRNVEAGIEYVGRVYIAAMDEPAATSEPFEIPENALSAATECMSSE